MRCSKGGGTVTVGGMFREERPLGIVVRGAGLGTRVPGHDLTWEMTRVSSWLRVSTCKAALIVVPASGDCKTGRTQ